MNTLSIKTDLEGRFKVRLVSPDKKETASSMSLHLEDCAHLVSQRMTGAAGNLSGNHVL